MNYIENDRGEFVIAVGAPGSPARAAVEHPTKIEVIDEMYTEGAELQEVIDYLIGLGIKSELERESILSHTMFKGRGV